MGIERGWGSGEQERFDAKRERLNEQLTKAQRDLSVATVALECLNHFETKSEPLEASLTINEKGVLEFARDDEGHAITPPMAIFEMVFDKTPAEAMDIARRVEQENVVTFTFEQDPYGKTLGIRIQIQRKD